MLQSPLYFFPDKMHLPLGEAHICLAPPTAARWAPVPLGVIPPEYQWFYKSVHSPPHCPKVTAWHPLCGSPCLLIHSQGRPFRVPSWQRDCRQHILGLILWTSGKNNNQCSPTLHYAFCSSRHIDREKHSGESYFLVHFSCLFLDDLYLLSEAKCSAECQKKTTPGHSFKGTFLFGLLFS